MEHNAWLKPLQICWNKNILGLLSKLKKYFCLINLKVFIKSNINAPKSKDDSGHSEMDTDGWKGIVTPKEFAENSTDLCATIANLIKKLHIEKDLANSLEAFQSFRFIPLDKNPLFGPIRFEDVLKRIVGKVIVTTLRDDIIASVVRYKYA